LGKLIVTKRHDIRCELEKADIDPREIAALIEGEHQSIPNLLHRSLDVDRMDYLVRDSLYTGVPYGSVDLDYILNNIEVTKSGEIVLNSKARFAAEHLLLARYFMFNTVYLHKTVFGFEEVVRRILLLLLERNGDIYRSGQEVKRLVIGNSPEFLDFHDGYVDGLIDENAKNRDKQPLTILCKAVKLRHPPSLIHQVIDLYDTQKGSVSEEYTRFKVCLEKELEQIADACRINIECLIWREPKDVEFEAVNPFTSISRARGAEEEELKELVRIREPSGKVINLIEDKKSIIHHLSQLSLKVIRLYAIESDLKKIEKLKKEVIHRLK
jgi:HD superfamily phosphohydrolase